MNDQDLFCKFVTVMEYFQLLMPVNLREVNSFISFNSNSETQKLYDDAEKAYHETADLNNDTTDEDKKQFIRRMVLNEKTSFFVSTTFIDPKTKEEKDLIIPFLA